MATRVPTKHISAKPSTTPIAQGAEFINRTQAARLLGCSVQTIDSLFAQNKLRKYKPFRRVLVKRTELIALVEASQV